MTVPSALTSTAPTQNADGEGRQRLDSSMASLSQPRSASLAVAPRPGARSASGPPGARSAIPGLADPARGVLQRRDVLEQVAQQHHLTDLAGLDEGHLVGRPMGVAARAGEPGS